MAMCWQRQTIQARRSDFLRKTSNGDPHLFIAAMMILLSAFLWAQTAFADEALLRGPRRAVRAGAETAEPMGVKQGIIEDIVSAPVLFYQRFLGQHWGQRCAYYPSCSHYALLAMRKHGAVVGSVMTFDRLQHEANEARYSPLIRTAGEIKVYDPLENNDYWWYKAKQSVSAAPSGAEKDTKP
jgi:hypothetical protein